MEYQYYKSWKKLMIAFSAGSGLILLLHTCIAFEIMQSGIGYLGRAIGPCHVAWIPLTVVYVKNYHYLLEQKIMTKSTGRFLSGLAVILGCEIINIVLLVFALIQG